MSKAIAKKQKKENEKKYALLEPVFKLKIVGNTRALCTHIGSLDKSEQLSDELIERPNGDIIFPKISRYEIVGKSCLCRIPGSYLLENVKLPVAYVGVMYISQLVTGSLLNYYIYFTMDDETKKSLLLPKQYVNKQMIGKYILQLVDNEGFKKYYLNKKKSDIENELLEKIADDFDIASEQDQGNMLEKISIAVDEKLATFSELFDPVEITGSVNRSKLLLKIEHKLKDSTHQELMNIAIQFTEDERRQRMGEGATFKPPKKVINLKDFKDDPSKLEEYINNMSSDSEPESDDSSN
jgi:hypothetical protein